MAKLRAERDALQARRAHIREIGRQVQEEHAPLFEKLAAHDAGESPEEQIARLTAERDALRKRITTYAEKCHEIFEEYRAIDWREDQVVPALFEARIFEVGIMADMEERWTSRRR